MKNNSRSNEIAIVGIGCRMPNAIRNPVEFWEFLLGKGDAIVPTPPDRWSTARFFDQDPQAAGKIGVTNGGFLDTDPYAFDASFFGVSPREAAVMDPQQRLLLEVAFEAMEEGGIVPAKLAGTPTGVYVGGFALDNLIIQSSPLNRLAINHHHTATAASMTMLAARLSYSFDFRGPSLSMDTACSSSLVAIHYACQGLIHGECDTALAGGVNVMLSPQYPMVMSKGHFLSADGHCKSFDSRANGYARGEGAGIVVLKRLEDAVRDGNAIHAVIVGTGVNQDGRTDGITVPSADAQEALIREVAERSGVALSDVVYVEAHGTGTPVGDPLEASALGRTVGAGRAQDRRVLIGSVKANIGHLEAAAGVAGLVKATLCLKHRAVPPQAQLIEPNPNIPFSDLGLKLPFELEPLPEQGRLLVGVNSFGYGGTNAHAILRSFDGPVAVPAHVDREDSVAPLLVPISARSEAALKELAGRYAQAIEASADPAAALSDMVFSTLAYRSEFDHQAVAVGAAPAAVVEALRAYSTGDKPTQVVVGRRQRTVRSPVAFVFSGMGPQWWGMGRSLLSSSPVFKAQAEAIDQIFCALSGWSILEEMAKPEAESRMARTEIAQPANFVVQAGLAAMLESRGITPTAIVGHSVGEIAAAYVSGALSLQDAVCVVYHRSRLQQTTAGTGTMLAVGLPQDEALELLKGREALVSIGAINSPRAVTLAGDEVALKEIAEFLDARAVFHRFLQVEVPYHSPLMEPLRAGLQASLATIQPRAPRVPLYSTVTGKLCTANEPHDANYWFANVRQPVRFQAAIESMMADGLDLYCEIGPHPVLSTSIRECVTAIERTADIFHTLRRNQPDTVRAELMLVDLMLAGAQVDPVRFSGSARRVGLPAYPWQRERYWNETDASRKDRVGAILHPLLGAADETSPVPLWVADVSVNFAPWLVDHCIDDVAVFPGAGYVEAALAARRALHGSATAIVEGIAFEQALVLDANRRTSLSWQYTPDSGELQARTRSDEAGSWTRHASLKVLAAEPWSTPGDLAVLRTSITATCDVADFYRALAARGLRYGPMFQTVRGLSLADGQVLADLCVSDALQADAHDYLLHPTLLDGAFQALIAACGDGASGDRLFMPVGIRRVLFHATPGARAIAHGRLVQVSEESLEGDITLYDEAGQPVVEVQGFRCIAVGAAGKKSDARLASLLYAYRWDETEPETAFADDARWLVLSDGGELGEAMAPALVKQGAREVVVVRPGASYGRVDDTQFSARPGETSDLQAVFAAAKLEDCRAIVDLWSCAASLRASDADPTGEAGVNRLRALVQALPEAEQAPRLYIVSRQARTVSEDDEACDPSQAASLGFLRVVGLERPELRVTSIDIDAAKAAVATRRIVNEILSDTKEDEVALRAAARYVHRLVRRPDLLAPVEAQVALDSLTGPRAYQLETGSVGQIDSLRYREQPLPAPGAGEISLKVLSTALNFKDILKVMGVLPKGAYENTFHGESLGMEASAVVVALGEGVDGYRVGDRVVASIPGSLASHVTVKADQLFALRQPEGQSGAEGATIPVAFMTAYYALKEVANLQPGERVLIHAATGGVGLAAIQIAKWLGAEIHATAGSPAKREKLHAMGVTHVWNSRSLEFAENIRQATAGRGVDVVLNSLPGETLQASLACLASFGRFIEIGKRDIMENSRLPMRPFNENLSFSSVDLDRMMVERPALVRRMLAAISQLMDEGILAPLPYTAFKASHVTEAFRHMAQAKHIGKIVIEFSDEEGLSIIPRPRDPVGLKPDASYLVTGAFGGAGLELARQLAANGARHLMLMGRSGAVTEEAQATVAALRAEGVQVHEARADVADAQSLQQALAQGLAVLPPLKGVFHAAAVLDDGLISNLDTTRIAKVMLPKARGAWNLHLATEAMPLDIFMTFSSMSAQLGNPGQGSYVAANAFLDALIEHRRRRGLAGSSMAWGALGGAGMLAGDNQAKRQLEMAGVRQIPIEEAMSALIELTRLDPGLVAVMDVDLSAWSAVFPRIKELPRLAALAAEVARDDASQDFRSQLVAMAPAERMQALSACLLEIVAGALQISPERIDINQPLTELGIDSLIGVEMQTAINARLGVQISILQLSKGGAITDMSKALMRKLVANDGDVGNDDSQRLAA